mmetsp:Transcript_2830/g.8470  ORF Transcript_2830/g.8470 Transcript_2830/m.8470 type:complete len:101 (-) Transcript_2830:29-331(-)
MILDATDAVNPEVVGDSTMAVASRAPPAATPRARSTEPGPDRREDSLLLGLVAALLRGSTALAMSTDRPRLPGQDLPRELCMHWHDCVGQVSHLICQQDA